MAVSRKTNESPAAVKLDRLTGLAKRWDSKKGAADDARSDLGTLSKEVEDLGFNRAAFKFVMKVRNMEPDKRNDLLSSINTYSQFFGIFTQGDLFGDAPTGIGPNNGAGDAREVSEAAAYLAGEKAGARGDAAATNPFPADTEASASWLSGWTSGQADKVRRDIKPALSPDSETAASA